MKSTRTKLKSLKKPISGKSKVFTVIEKRHIQAHLALTELRLRIKSVGNQETLSNRVAALDILHDYWRKGVFPKNTHKTFERTPVFIDDSGVHCAVGRLMAQTGHSSLAKQINNNDKFVSVEQLDNSQAELWLKKYGISREEAALIQPGYGGFIIERVSYSLQDKILGIVSLVASLALLAFVAIALRLLKNKTLPKPKKRNHFLKIALATVAIIAGFILYLPYPNRAIEAITSGTTSKETITCGGFGAGELTGICKEFQDKGSVPGWRKVPCEGICLL